VAEGSDEGTREKVAILGGGIAGLTAALELTAPEQQNKYDVTLYQLGWRCGGKCATGRDPDPDHANRIQEHGLHLWFGGYDNAFKLLARCYDELDRPLDAPLATMDQAWHPLSEVVLYDNYDGTWTDLCRKFPVAPGRPWEQKLIPRFWDLLAIVAQMLFPQLRDRLEANLKADLARLPRVKAPPSTSFVAHVAHKVGTALEHQVRDGLQKFVDWHHSRDARGKPSAHPVAWTVEKVRDGIWCFHAKKHMDDAKTRQSFSHIDFFTTIAIGMIRDEVLWKGFDSINHLDLREWLTKHGLQPTTLDGPDVRVVYDESFAGVAGPTALDHADPARGYKPEPSFAAGAALYGVLRTELPYRGSVMWQANAGMGDTAIAPMYLTLRKRGASVKFFHEVTHLGVDGVRGVIDSIEMIEQATPNQGEYEPLIEIQGLPCWPAEPQWDQLRDGDQLQHAGVDFERGGAQPGAPKVTLKLDERDFDHVVLAIPVGALAPICAEVMAHNPRFEDMMRHSNTVMTQAFQIWLNTAPSDLGFEYGHTATSAFIEPVDTGCDNSQVLEREDWTGDDRPVSVWYFCGTLEDVPGDDADRTNARAKEGALDYLANIGAQWKCAVRHGSFDWDLLTAPAGTAGPARFDAQYWRANSAPTERYVQTLPGTIEHRLSAGESGLSNLYLAGDWTKNGFNIGAVEAAVMSGMRASRALSTLPKKIAWEKGAWMAQ
jgi:uncharacterized protein with NAD-binding domain and iron-sulfur cluster